MNNHEIETGLEAIETILADEDFSFRDAGSVVELLAALHRHGVAVDQVQYLDHADLSIPVDRVQAYVDHIHAAAAHVYGEEGLYFHRQAVEEIGLASREAVRLASQGLLAEELAQVLCAGFESLSRMEIVVLPLPPVEETEEIEFGEPIEQPPRPFRASSYALRQALRAAEAGPLSAEQRSAAVEAVEFLRSPEALQEFRAAVEALESEAPCDDNRDVNLLEALSLRELGSQLYAADGDPALLQALERVDETLDDPRYRNALLTVSEDRWEFLNEDRVSSDHWWGVRTAAEMFEGEFVPEIADALEDHRRE